MWQHRISVSGFQIIRIIKTYCNIVVVLVSSVSDPGFFADPGLKSPDPDPSINKLMGSK